MFICPDEFLFIVSFFLSDICKTNYFVQTFSYCRKLWYKMAIIWCQPKNECNYFALVDYDFFKCKLQYLGSLDNHIRYISTDWGIEKHWKYSCAKNTKGSKKKVGFNWLFPAYTDLIRPLIQLTCKTVLFLCTTQYQKVFDLFKVLLKSKMLVYTDPK